MSEGRESVLITGCSSGIGRATAQRFHEHGWTVYATARTPSDVEQLADQGMQVLELDVTLDEDCKSAVERIVAETGGIDCLVNNAGYSEIAAVEELTLDALQAQFEVNTYGPQRLMRAALPTMREQGDGTIVNMSSVGGQLPQPGLGAYCASKFALEALSDAARAEVDQFGVDIVLVEPGPVQTSFNETVEAAIAADDRTDSPYRDYYDRLGEFNEAIDSQSGTDLLTALMAAITVPPDRVAEVVVTAAEVSDPKTRYSVATPHRLMAMGRLLPDRVRDRVFQLML